MTRRILILLGALSLTAAVSAQKGRGARYEVPFYGNTYYDVVNKSNFDFSFGRAKDKELVLSAKKGLAATTYVYLTAGQSASLSLLAAGKGKLQVSVEVAGLQSPKIVKLNLKPQTSNLKPLYKIGTLKTDRDGYIALRMRLLDEDGEAKIQSLILEGLDKAPVYLKPETNTYFGLRGPSCHLNYDAGRLRGKEVDWALMSVTVPQELDREGSYYMALGFSGGYFGMQNNGRGVRNVLFSVWNTQESDDPKAVASEHQVLVVGHGEGVTAQNFGGEGSGKQSFINAGWLPGHTYQFLLHAERVDDRTVDYSGWFHDTVSDRWIYLSTLRRPNTGVLLTGLHSFLENFDPLQGNKTRKAYYHDGWIHTTDGEWRPIRRAHLTNDGTGRDGKRLDFLGGVEGKRFFLQNGGYFDRAEEIDRTLTIEDATDAQPPTLDLSTFQLSTFNVQR